MDLYPHQLQGATFLANKKRAMLFDDCGVGKTAQALAAIKIANNKKIIIVAPASITGNWVEECAMWLGDEFRVHKFSSYKDEIPSPSHCVVVSYGLLSGRYRTQVIDKLKEFGADTLIIDEAHFIKSVKSKRTLSLFNLKDIDSIYLLTGTPVVNHGGDLFPLLHIIKPDIYDNYYRFEAKWTNKKIRKMRGKVFEVPVGVKDKEKLHKEIKPFFLKRRKKDVLKNLPDKIIRRIKIQLEKKDFKEFKELFSWYNDNKGSIVAKLEANEKVSDDKLASLREALGLVKVKQVCSFIKDELEDGKSIVLFAYHKKVIAEYAEFFKDLMPSVINGETPKDKRQGLVERFQGGMTKLFIGQITAAGTGITLTKSSFMVFAELPWTAADLTQAEDRIHRISQNDVPYINYVLAKDTLDDAMFGVIQNKKRAML